MLSHIFNQGRMNEKLREVASTFIHLKRSKLDTIDHFCQLAMSKTNMETIESKM